MFPNSVEGERCNFSQYLFFPSIIGCLEIIALCTSQKTESVLSMHLPHWHRIITGCTSHTVYKSFRLQWFKGSSCICLQVFSTGDEYVNPVFKWVKPCPLPRFHRWGRLHACKNSVQSISKFSLHCKIQNGQARCVTRDFLLLPFIFTLFSMVAHK